MSAEVEAMLKKFSSMPNVEGIIVADYDGIAIKSTFENAETLQYTHHMHNLVEKARQVLNDLDNTNEFISMRMRTLTHEVLLVPNDNYFIIVVQNPCD